MLSKDHLRLNRLDVRTHLFSLPSASAPEPGPIFQPAALSAPDAAAIYGAIARFGFTNFQLVPGGARISGNNADIMLTGSLWQYVEDLDRSSFEPALDKLSVTIREFMSRMPANTMLMAQFVDLHATWEGMGGDARTYVQERFFTDGALAISTGLASRTGLEERGGGIRLHLTRQAEKLPAKLISEGEGTVTDGFDVRIEPLFADTTKLFVQVTGTFAPTAEVGEVEARTRFTHAMLWEHLAGIMAGKA